MSTGPGHWVELRIHGVSGTPPESMLCSAHAKQIAGDEYGRIFRPVDSMGNERQDEPHRLLEGYHWGQFTSGSWRQGLWLLLVPFGFVNAAQFMLPAPTTPVQKTWHAVAGSLLRLIGLALTCTFAYTIGLIAVDLLAWRGAVNLAVTADRAVGLVLAAGTVGAAAMIYGMFRLGCQTRTIPSPNHQPDLVGRRVAGGEGLARAAFYAGDPDAPTLGRLHLAAAVTMVALVGLVGLREHVEGGAPTALTFAGWVLLAVVATLVLLLGDPERSVSVDIDPLKRARRGWHRFVGAVSLGIAIVAASLVGLTAGWLWLSSIERDGERLTALDLFARILVLVVTIGLTALFVACGALAWTTRRGAHRHPARFRRYAGGMAAPLATSVGVFLGVGFTGAFAHATSVWVGQDGSAPVLERMAHAWGLTMLLLVVMLVLGVAVVLVSRRTHEREAVAAFGWAQPRTVPDRWRRRIATARAVARLKNQIPLVFIVFAVFGMALCAVAAWEFSGTPVPAVERRLGWMSAERVDGQSQILINVGAWSLVALAGLLLLVGRRAVQEHGPRRAVNVIWDVVSFWPHSTHPFVPPAYSQSAVPELRDRIRWHLGTLGPESNRDPADCVVVAAHSQGSLIAFAAMLWLTEDEVQKVALLTFGSQLQVAFARAFPAYVDYDLVDRVHRTLDGRWVNLYRDTDPIAGPVLSWDHSSSGDPRPASRRVGAADRRTPDAVRPVTGRRECGGDWRLLDPAPVDADLQAGCVSRLLRHGDFPDSPDWAEAIEAIRVKARVPVQATARH
ncbi:MAG: hypothetical protein GEU96_02220 [Propionibacteriales bacterium]|nr:hypothetical protein [Propionibacteriales bacterium]